MTAKMLDTVSASIAFTTEAYAMASRGACPRSVTTQVASGIAAAEDVIPAFVLASLELDDAGRSVIAASVVAAMARRAELRPRQLLAATEAALIADTGKAWLSATAGIDLSVFEGLPDELEALAPAAVAALALIESQPDDLVPWIAFEALWLERESQLGPVYDGAHHALATARMLAVARSWVLSIAPRDKRDRCSPALALQALTLDPRHDPGAVALLLATLGPLPIGTVVELSDGRWAIVSQRGPDEAPASPRVRPLTDARGQAATEPEDIDITDDSDGPRLRRVIEPGEARFNVARAFFGG